MFKLWSETNLEAKKVLEPDLGLRGWNDLNSDDKDKIWHYLEWYFFDALFWSSSSFVLGNRGLS